jgi:hypothetical protein
MKNYIINIFVRVIKRKMNEENLSAEEVINNYSGLSDNNKQEILSNFI